VSHRTSKGSNVLDRSKIPSDLVVHRVWMPEPNSERRPIAYASERRRRVVAVALIALALALVVVAVLLTAMFWLAFFPLLIAWVAIGYAGGGRAGYYQVDEDGALGDFLGPSQPDLTGLAGQKPKFKIS
jgi:hypothetical protein